MNETEGNAKQASGGRTRSGVSAFLFMPLDEVPPFSYVAWIRVLPKKRMSPRRLIDACELPAELRGLIQDVVRRTRLWRSERLELARELIGHFEDGIENGMSASQLTESFGDVPASAKLIRRARKRNRNVAWQAWRRCWQLIGCLLLLTIGLYGFSAARMFLGSPTISHDYLGDLNAPAEAIAEDQRAWPIYVRALMAYDFDGRKASEVAKTAMPGDGRWASVVESLNRNQLALSQLRDAAGSNGLGYIAGCRQTLADYEFERHLNPDLADLSAEEFVQWNVDRSDNGQAGLTGVFLSHLGPLRFASGLLYNDAFRAAEAGDGEVAFADIEAMLSVGDHSRELSTLISDLVAIAIWHRAYNAIGSLLRDDPDLFTNDQLVRLAHHLSRLGDSGDVRVRLESERLIFLDFLQRAYTDNGHGDGYLTAHGARLFEMFAPMQGSFMSPYDGLYPGLESLLKPVSGFVTASRRDMLEMYDDALNSLIAHSKEPMWTWTNDPKVDAQLERMGASKIDRIRYAPIVLLLPALSNLANTNEMSIQFRDAVLTGIALELHHRRNERWPDALSDLAPTLLPAVPKDRFDGKALKYRLVDGRPLVYSVGTDLDDDGGREVAYGPNRPDGFVGMRWKPRERVEAIKASGQGSNSSAGAILPDGDWILWPMPRGVSD